MQSSSVIAQTPPLIHLGCLAYCRRSNRIYSLPSRDTVLAHTMHVTLHREQIRIIKAAISAATRDGEGETYGNTDKNGNGLAKVVKEWLAANTSSAESEDL